ncbi:MAG: hypothetical protein ACRDRV_21290 [Pseudonocardiaceae bacterium]
MSLPNLRPDEAVTYLGRVGVPTYLHEQVAGFTRGHPLALALAVDVLRHGAGDTALDVVQAPDVVQALLVRFVEGLPSQLHRHCVQVCAEARTTTEAVLRAALGREDVHDLFEWLRELSFVDCGPHGIFPHELARDVLVADLTWRDPELRQTLHGRIRAHAASRLHAARGRRQQLAILDFLFTEYSDPVFRSYWTQWDTMGRSLGEPALPQDRAAILTMVERHEGRESAEMAAHWFDRQRSSFIVYRNGREIQGFVGWLALHEATPADIEKDPGTRSGWRHVVRTATPAPDEDVLMLRFLMDCEAYQGASQLFNVGSVQHVLQVLGRPRLRWDLLAVADPGFWAPLWAHVGYHRVEEADFAVGSRGFAVFGRDWRTASLPPKWAELLGARQASETTVLPPPTAQPDFDAAVRQALRDLRRPDRLARSPLLRCRLVRDRGGDSPTSGVLVDLVCEAAEVLRHHPRDEKLFRAVDRTYLRPAQTQELAAELLGLPFSTYRRHLNQGVARIVSWLWDRESAATQPGEQHLSRN